MTGSTSGGVSPPTPEVNGRGAQHAGKSYGNGSGRPLTVTRATKTIEDSVRFGAVSRIG